MGGSTGDAARFGECFPSNAQGPGFHPQVLQQQKGSAFEISGDKEIKMRGRGLGDDSVLQAG